MYVLCVKNIQDDLFLLIHIEFSYQIFSRLKYRQVYYTEIFTYFFILYSTKAKTYLETYYIIPTKNLAFNPIVLYLLQLSTK